MKVLHLLAVGDTGGIEVLMRNYVQYSKHENVFFFLWTGGVIADEMKAMGAKIEIGDLKTNGMVKVLRQLALICKQEQIELVVAHHASPYLKMLLLYMKAVIPGITTVAYAHGNATGICQEDRKKGYRLRKFV